MGTDSNYFCMECHRPLSSPIHSHCSECRQEGNKKAARALVDAIQEPLKDKWDKLLDYVTSEEDRHYEMAGKEMDKGNTSGMMFMQLQAGAFQRVRYFMETITEEGK